MAVMRLESVAKIYRGRDRDIPAVSDISLMIGQGEFVFIVGSRGAGKSTLLDLMAGIVKPDRGTVYLDDENLNSGNRRQNERLRAAIGRLGQEMELRRTDSVYENLAVWKQAGLFKKKVVDTALADKALGLVGMAGFGERMPRYLSPPENRRIQMAQAIMKSPSILLLDDFTDQMDEDTAWDMLHLLDELNRRGTTIIMATNSSYIVNYMRRRVVTLADGKVAGDVKRGRYGYIG